MQKISDGHVRFGQTYYPSEGVKLEMQVERFDGEDLDTSVEFSGGVAISGQQREEFNKELGELIDKYRI